MANKMRDWRSNEYLAAYKAAIKHNYAWIEEARAADAPVDATRFSQRRESKGPWANATFDAAAAARLKNGGALLPLEHLTFGSACCQTAATSCTSRSPWTCA